MHYLFNRPSTLGLLRFGWVSFLKREHFAITEGSYMTSATNFFRPLRSFYLKQVEHFPVKSHVTRCCGSWKLIIIFSVFSGSMALKKTEKKEIKEKEIKKKQVLKEMKKKEYHSEKFSAKTKKQQHPYPILNIMHELKKFRALF